MVLGTHLVNYTALAYPHVTLLPFRDIKSLNVFLTKGGLCKLGDFGISKIMTSQTQMAESVSRVHAMLSIC